MADAPSDSIDYARRHLRVGWWALLVFATIGLILESLHGFKVRAYLDVSNETRRLVWTLGHAHGTALGVINILFGLTARAVPGGGARWQTVSRFLIGATVALPGGFLLGGIGAVGGDPGLGVLLVPVGAVLLLAALFGAARLAGDVEGEPTRRVPSDDKRGRRQ